MIEKFKIQTTKSARYFQIGEINNNLGGLSIKYSELRTISHNSFTPCAISSTERLNSNLRSLVPSIIVTKSKGL